MSSINDFQAYDTASTTSTFSSSDNSSEHSIPPSVDFPEIDLRFLPPTDSLASLFLAPQPPGKCLIVTNGILPLDNALVVCLALNESCHHHQRGFFHHTPPADNTRFGHSCDLILTNREWSASDLLLWETSTWLERLALSEIEDLLLVKADPEEERKRKQQLEQEEGYSPPDATALLLNPTAKVVPICTRFLVAVPPDTPIAPVTMESNTLFYRPNSGPPANANYLKYVRSATEYSSWLLLFDSAGTPSLLTTPPSTR
jgi:hypothetical protein